VWNVLVGTGPKKIVQGLNVFGKGRPSKRGMGIFGDGRASGKIIQILMRSFS
jgi:hypothetical protein